MSWKSIAGNQTVSRANLQDAIDTGVFIAKNGVPGTEANRQITKANAQDYVYTWDLYPSFRSKASNQLPVKSNLAVQSNQIYAVTDTSLFVGNNNRNWTYNILSAPGDFWGSVASATDNRCILAGKSYTPGAGGGSAFVSNDYGENFRRLDEVMSTNDAALGAAMNSFGDYMIITRQVGSFGSNRAYIYWSYDSGINWPQGYHDGIDYNFNGAAMSGNGVYATVLGSDGTDYYVFRSVSFGSSFTRTFLSKGPKVVQGGCVGMSKSGQYQLLTPPQGSSPDIGYFYLSNDWGLSWTPIDVTPVPLLPNDIFYGCSVSAGGDYMTVSAFSNTIGIGRTYISNDFGVNWTVVSGSAVAQAVDSSGQFQYQNNRASIDYGNTWGSGVSARAISVNPTTFTTPYIYGPSTGGNLYRSVDQGSTYSVTSLSGFITKVATSGGSNNGKYVAAVVDNDPGGFPNYSLYQSSNFGATWTTNLFFGGQVLSCCAVSDDGVYWLAAIFTTFPSIESFIYRSTDGGASWSYTGFSYGGTAENCAISNTGQYMTIILNNGTIGYNSFIVNSTNYGATWSYSSGGYDNTGRTYNDIAMSGQGRYRLLVNTDSGNTGCRTFYSADYGQNWGEKYYNADHIATSCDMDDSGRVCLVGNVYNDYLAAEIYWTTSGWNSYSSYSTAIYPLPLARPTISGVNVSSDGTYWAAVADNSPYVFTCTTGDGAFNYQNTGITFSRLSK
jgi:photosystem II stability/assembly factor-like uncharacterized protein